MDNTDVSVLAQMPFHELTSTSSTMKIFQHSMRSLTTMCLLMEKVSVLLETLKIMTLKSLQLKICQVAYIILFCLVKEINDYMLLIFFCFRKWIPSHCWIFIFSKSTKEESQKARLKERNYRARYGAIHNSLVNLVDGSENNTCTQYWDEIYCQLLSNNPGLTCFS